MPYFIFRMLQVTHFIGAGRHSVLWLLTLVKNDNSIETGMDHISYTKIKRINRITTEWHKIFFTVWISQARLRPQLIKSICCCDQKASWRHICKLLTCIRTTDKWNEKVSISCQKFHIPFNTRLLTIKPSSRVCNGPQEIAMLQLSVLEQGQ